MSRFWVLVAVAGSAISFALLLSPWSGAASRVATWSTLTLQPVGYAADPAVAVGSSGRVVVAWDAGQPGSICIGGPPAPSRAARAACGQSSHLRIMAAVGTVGGSGPGVGRVVDVLGADVRSFPRVAVAQNGTAYAVWQADRRGDWVVAAAPGGRFSDPHPLGIPARAQLQELVSAGAGPVAAVWLQYGVRHAPAYRYALLGPGGRIGPVITIADVGSPLEGVQFAINDHGAAAASWINDGRPFGGPRVSAELCTRAGDCSPRQTIRFRRPIGQYQNVATTLSDGGTAAIILAGYTIPTPPAEFSREAGLQAAVSHRGGAFLAGPQISATGQQQVADAVGDDSAAALFNIGGIPVKTIAWSRLAAHGFTPPRVLDHEQVGPGLVAAGTPEGDVALAWFDAPVGEISDTSYSIHAALETAGSPGTPATIVPASDHVAGGELAGGIDSHGEAIVVWDKTENSQTAGVFATVGLP